MFVVSTEGLKGQGWDLNSSVQRFPQDTQGVFPKSRTQTLHGGLGTGLFL